MPETAAFEKIITHSCISRVIRNFTQYCVGSPHTDSFLSHKYV